MTDIPENAYCGNPTCAHRRSQHGAIRSVCLVSGCDCERFQRHNEPLKSDVTGLPLEKASAIYPMTLTGDDLQVFLMACLAVSNMAPDSPLATAAQNVGTKLKAQAFDEHRFNLIGSLPDSETREYLAVLTGRDIGMLRACIADSEGMNQRRNGGPDAELTRTLDDIRRKLRDTVQKQDDLRKHPDFDFSDAERIRYIEALQEATRLTYDLMGAISASTSQGAVFSTGIRQRIRSLRAHLSETESTAAEQAPAYRLAGLFTEKTP